MSRLRTAPRTILFRRGGGYLRVLADDIYYAEAFSHSVALVMKSGKETFHMRFSDVEDLLGEGFFRCHRSYIVSMKHVRRVTRTALVLDNGVKLGSRGASTTCEPSLHQDLLQVRAMPDGGSCLLAPLTHGLVWLIRTLSLPACRSYCLVPERLVAAS